MIGVQTDLAILRAIERDARILRCAATPELCAHANEAERLSDRFASELERLPWIYRRSLLRAARIRHAFLLLRHGGRRRLMLILAWSALAKKNLRQSVDQENVNRAIRPAMVAGGDPYRAT